MINHLLSIPAIFYVLILCGVILVAGLVYSIHLGDELRFSDETTYYLLVSNLIEQGRFSIDGVNETAAKPPGYVFFLWLLGLFNASIFVFRYVNFVLLAASMVMVYKITAQRGGALAGLLASVMLAGYGVLFYTASTLYPQTLAGFLFITIIYILANNETLSIWHSVAIGVLFAWLILTVLTFAFALVIVAGWLLFKPGVKLWPKLRTLAIVFTIVVALVGVWSYRNYNVFDRFVLISTQSDAFLVGNSENTHPQDGPVTDISHYDTPEVRAMNEADRDAYFRAQALAYITENPVDWLGLYIGKVLHHFHIDNKLGTVSEESPLNTVIMALTYGPLMLVFVVRLALVRRFRLTYFELLLIVLYLAAAFYTALVFTRIRYRLTYDMLLIIVVALFLAQFEAPIRKRLTAWRWSRRKRSAVEQLFGRLHRKS